MAKQMGKYFLAIVPNGEIQEKATGLKYEIRDLFNIKYALKSPAHVTLKMPFVWNEAKENILVDKLSHFFGETASFKLVFKGIGRFGRRVIYIRVEEQHQLTTLQSQLSAYCKKELNLNQELSDQAYHPHMTICFKDLKDKHFDDCLKFLKERGFYGTIEVQEVALLKKENFKWHVIHSFLLNK